MCPGKKTDETCKKLLPVCPTTLTRRKKSEKERQLQSFLRYTQMQKKEISQ